MVKYICYCLRQCGQVMVPGILGLQEGMERRGHVARPPDNWWLTFSDNKVEQTISILFYLPLLFLIWGSVGMVYGEKWIRRKTRLPWHPSGQSVPPRCAPGVSPCSLLWQLVDFTLTAAPSAQGRSQPILLPHLHRCRQSQRNGNSGSNGKL